MTNETKISKTKKYTPNMNLLRAYSDVTDHLPTPTLAVFEFDNKKLIYCGTEHSADVSFQLIDKCFNDYDIDCVVTEVHRNTEPVKIQTHTRSRNELTYSAQLGYKRDIPVILADSSKYDWFTDLLKVDSNYLKPLQVFFMLDDAHTYKQHFKENFSIERALKNTIHKYWDDTLPLPMTREEFQEYFLEQFGIEITDDNISDIYTTHPEWHCPDNNGSLLNKMWSDIGMISRDPYMVKCIFDAVNSHDCVLATFGAGHLNKQIRILEQAFGKPTFVDITDKPKTLYHGSQNEITETYLHVSKGNIKGAIPGRREDVVAVFATTKSKATVYAARHLIMGEYGNCTLRGTQNTLFTTTVNPNISGKIYLYEVDSDGFILDQDEEFYCPTEKRILRAITLDVREEIRKGNIKIYVPKANIDFSKLSEQERDELFVKLKQDINNWCPYNLSDFDMTTILANQGPDR